MSELNIAIIVIGCIGVLLTIARRIRNDDPNAGYGVAGWTMIIILILLFFGSKGEIK